MKNLKKFVLFLLIFTCFAINVFGETYLGLGFGFYRLSEEFPKENYGRVINGSDVLFSLHYFPNESSLGFSLHVTVGNLFSGFEWKGEKDMNNISGIGIWDIRICPAPSYKFILGPKVRIPVSFGPVFGLYVEQFSDYLFYEDYTEVRSTYYEAFNFGLLADASIIANPFSQRFSFLFFKGGILAQWDFLRIEKGEMSMEYRTTRNARYKVVPYLSFGLSLYLGFGVLLD